MFEFLSTTTKIADIIVRETMRLPGVKAVIGVDKFAINDRSFTDQLEEIRSLKRFLFAEKVHMAPAAVAAVDLGKLNNLKYHRYGRKPIQQEWTLLDIKLSALTEHLTPELRRKIKIWELGRYFGGLPLGFLICAIVALAVGFFFPRPFKVVDDNITSLESIPLFVAVVLWSISLGGLGACAFLGTTLLSGSQSDFSKSKLKRPHALSDFDITDTRLVNTRLVMGILFSFLLGFPFASASLRFVLDKMYQGTVDLKFSSADLAMMVAPFLLGFSTNLVLVILERVISAVRSLFGINAPR